MLKVAVAATQLGDPEVSCFHVKYSTAVLNCFMCSNHDEMNHSFVNSIKFNLSKAWLTFDDVMLSSFEHTIIDPWNCVYVYPMIEFGPFVREILWIEIFTVFHIARLPGTLHVLCKGLRILQHLWSVMHTIIHTLSMYTSWNSIWIWSDWYPTSRSVIMYSCIYTGFILNPSRRRIEPTSHIATSYNQWCGAFDSFLYWFHIGIESQEKCWNGDDWSWIPIHCASRRTRVLCTVLQPHIILAGKIDWFNSVHL